MPTTLAISSEEEGYLANANLEAFWFSRLGKQDPVARIGYALWVSDVEKLKAAIHHIAFKKFGIRPDYYGGTWLGSVPDQAEMKAYGDLYCHDCDSAEGYQLEQAR